MPVHIVTDNNRKIIETMSMDKLDKCARCGKAYLLVLLKEGDKLQRFRRPVLPVLWVAHRGILYCCQ